MHISIDKIYIGIVKRHFRNFATELRPLIDVRIWFLLNILRMNGQNLTKFCLHIIIDKIYFVIVKHLFLQICNSYMALDWCQNLFFAQYLVNKWTELNQIVDTHHWWLLCVISFSNIVMPLNISFASDSDMARL